MRDYGHRVGVWRLFQVLSRYAIRASAALNSQFCDHHPEIIEEGNRLGWATISQKLEIRWTVSQRLAFVMSVTG